MTHDTVTSGAIWWAVDPFHDVDAFHEHALRVIAPYARALSTVIHPVTFIDAFRGLEPAGQWFSLRQVKEPLEELKAVVEKRLALLSKKAPEGMIGKPVIITHEGWSVPSLRDRVDAVSAAAKKHLAAFVAMHSHSRGGPERLYMGSFAETFMLYSNEPMLVFNPTCAVSEELRRVVFATDFSAESIHACETFQSLCLKLGASLSVTNVQPWYASLKMLSDHMRTEVESQTRDAAIKVEGLADVARMRGLKADAVNLSDPGSDSPSTSILDYARKNQVDLIALAAQSGPLTTTLVGATSRKIAREAHCPVLIYRSCPVS